MLSLQNAHIHKFQHSHFFCFVFFSRMCDLRVKTTHPTQNNSAVLTHTSHGNTVTNSKVERADTVSAVGNLSCSQGRSHLVFCINSNKCFFHGTSPVLSDHRDLSEAPGYGPAVCLSVSSLFSHKSLTRHLPRYL